MQKIALIAALLFSSSNAFALNQCAIKDFATSAELLAAASKNCTIAYAQDSAVFYQRTAGTWAPIGSFGSALTVTTDVTLSSTSCGKTILVTAAFDTHTITLPATIAGCQYRIVYVGANGGALLDISPNAVDGVYGGCTLAASVVSYSGTDDADVGLTKATIKRGDSVTLVGDGVDGWYQVAGLGICANN